MVREFNTREDYIVFRWKQDFPEHSHLTIDAIMLFINRVKKCGAWFSDVKEEWSRYSQRPVHLEGVISPEEYLISARKLFEFKELNKQRSRRIEAIAKEAQKKAELVNVEIDSKQAPLIADNIVYVISRDFSEIPLTYSSPVLVQNIEDDDERAAAEKEAVNLFQKDMIPKCLNGTFRRDELFMK